MRASAYVAPAKYAQVAWVLGLGGRGEDAARERLFTRVDDRRRYAEKKHRTKEHRVELPFAGGELLLAAEGETHPWSRSCEAGS